MDNRHVVPYNPYLSRKYNAHINVEICASIKVVKYLNKYIYKGTDLATLALNNANPDDSNDEVTTHINCRYLCPFECTVRVNEWHTYCEKPAVIRLGVHLENAQLIYFPVDCPPHGLEDIAENSQSMLVAFFKFNMENEWARQYLYIDFPEICVWLGKEKKWWTRQKGRAIGRLYFVPPTTREAYYLRLLLCNV